MNDTLQESKNYLHDNWEKGVECPCCKQFVKLYRRKITGAMALALVELYKENKRVGFSEYIHLAELLDKKGYSYQITNTGDKAKLKYWGLVDPMQGTREDGSKKVGRYRITQLGIDFVKGEAHIHEIVGLYNQHVYRVDNNRLITINEVWDTKFNYHELMKGY